MKNKEQRHQEWAAQIADYKASGQAVTFADYRLFIKDCIPVKYVLI